MRIRLLLALAYACFTSTLSAQSFSPTTLPTGVAGTYYSTTVTVTGIPAPVWCYIGGGSWPYFMNAVVGGSNTCTISGNLPLSSGSFSFTLMARDSAFTMNASQSYTLAYVLPLSITSTSIVGGTQGAPYSTTVAATGGTEPYSWSVASGSLPPGVSLSSGGALSGTPTMSGAFNFQARVTDSASATSTRSLSLTIESNLAIATSSLPGGFAGAAYTASLTPSNGSAPYSWSVLSGSFPPGLTLSAAGGISGTPSTPGAYNFTVKVTDSGTGVATKALSITVGASLAIATTVLPSGLAGSAYSTTISATAGSGSYSGWALTAGSLPPGITNGNTAANPLTLSGAPTTAGTYNFTWRNCDAVTLQCASQTLSIQITAALSIATPSLPNAAYGSGYSQALSASGGTPGYTWSIASGSLPAGLSLSSGGMISGTPTATDNFSITFKATDSTSPTAQIATKALTLHVNALPSVGVDSTAVFWGGGGAQPAGTTTTYYSSTPQVFGGGYSFTGYAAGPDATISGLQVRLDGTAITTPASGTASRADGCSFLGGPSWPGCPNAGFTYSFPASSYSLGAHTLSFRATDANGLVGLVSFPITIISLLSVSTTSLPNGLVGSAYMTSVAASGGVTPYTWQISSGSLPPGLTLSGSTISGMPTTQGAYSFTIKATDNASPTHQTATQSLSIYINPPLAITTAALPGGLVTTTYSQTLTASGGTPGYTWSLTAGALPSGLTLNSSGNIFGTPTTAGTSNFTVNVVDTTTPTAQTAAKALSITVSPALSITTESLPSGLATTTYSQTLAATGGTPSYTWSLASGSLPAGLSFSAAGVISGTPTTGGTTTFTVKATDSTAVTPQTATKSLGLTVVPAFSIVTTTLANAVAGTPYSQALVGNGGTAPYTWTVNSGTLPPGLTLSGATISGTPSAAGTHNFTVKGSDVTSSTQTATQALSIAVGAALTIATASLPNGLANTAYSQPLAASGGSSPYLWSLSAGTLPLGLSLTSSGSIYGTPTTAGTYLFTVRIADSTSPTAITANAPFSITIGPPLAVSTASLPAGMIGAAYAQTLGATGGTTPYTWSLASGALATGLTLSSTGVLSGIPTAAGLFSFVVQATDSTTPSTQVATRAFTVNVLAALTITTTSLPDGLVTTPYAQTLAATGGTPAYGWSLVSGSLPPGLALTGVGQLSGTPTIAGTYTFAITATDSTTPTALNAIQSLTITIGPALEITTPTLPDGVAGSPYAQLVSASGGTAPYKWSISTGSLPAGLSLSAGGGLYGTPTASGTFTFLLKATDSTAPTAQIATQPLSLVIAAGLVVTTTSLPPGLATTPYSQIVAATGGSTPYTWSLASGSLPNGLTLSSAGAISGTPTAAGSYAFVVRAIDATSPNAQSATQALSITVNAALSISTPSLAAGMVGQSYSQALSAVGGTPGYSWSISSGSLPTGLSLSGNTISGTATSAGTVTFTVTATDSTTPTAQTASTSLSVVIGAAFQVTTSSPLPPGLGGNPYSVKIQAAGGAAPYTFALASGAPPSGLSLQSDGTLSGIPTMAGSFLFSILATDSTSPAAQTQIRPLAITITPPLSITTTSLPKALVGTSYAQSIVATGGTLPYTWTLSSGTLPQGLSVSPDGSLLGRPTEAGAFTFAVKVTDNSPVPQFAIQALSLIVSDQLTITSSSLPPAVFGTTYNFPLTANGGTAPYKWTVVSGTLPPGLSVSLAGYISGTCTASGVYTVTVQATDSTSPTPQTATRVLTVDSNTSLSITTGALPLAQSAQSYITSLSAAGGIPPYTWSIAAGSLPTGLALAADGTIAGAPSVTGASTVSVRVTDSAANNTTRTFSLTVSAPLTITTTNLPPGSTASSYGSTLSASGGSTPYIWTIIAGSLPPGLTLSTSGLISGTLATAGTSSVTVQATDNSQPTPQTASKTLSLTITSPLTITSTLLPTAVAGVAYSTSLGATGGSLPYAWTVSSGALPAGLTLDGTGTLAGAPTTTGTSLFTVHLLDSATPKQSASRAFSIIVAAPVSVAAAILPNGIVGRSYSATLSATGGQPPYTWSVSAGALPTGLQLSAGGIISGTPTAAGTATFTAQAADAGGQTAAEDFTIAVTSDFSITVPSLPMLYVGEPLNIAASAAGGTAPYTWTLLSGQMPPGITLAADGALSGSPTDSGAFTFTIQGADSTAPAQTATQTLSTTVLTPLVINTPTLSPGTTGVQYSQALAATGGAAPYAWSLLSGSLPPGLTLSAVGSISGTPTAAGSYTATLALADSGSPAQNTTQRYTLTIVGPLSITTSSLATGLVSTPYTQPLAAAGGVPPYTWTILTGSLPSGLTLDPSGSINGTPIYSAAAVVTLQVTDSAPQGQQTATRAFTLTTGTQLAITTATLASGLESVPYSQTLAAVGGTTPYAWSLSAGQLPAGLTLSVDGAISGTPTAAGSFTFTVRALDSSQPAQHATAPLSITINPPLRIVSTSLPDPADGVAYSQVLAATGGTIPYTWSISTGSLPTGLVLNPDGALTGTPTGTGTHTFTVQVADSTQATPQVATAIFTLQTTVTFRITTVTIPPGVVGVPYALTLAAIDGATPYTWTAMSGTLPDGLNLSPTGTLAGTPANAGTFTFSIQATDSAAPNRTSSATFTVQIQPALTITTTTIADTTVGSAYNTRFAATGGNIPYTWTLAAGSLPEGLTLKADGTLSGIALTPASSTFTVQVSDSTQPIAQTASRPFIVNVTLDVSIATNSLADAYINVPYIAQLQALGGLAPYTWSATGLPDGMTLTSGGYLSGTPTTTGVFTVNVTVRDAYTPAHAVSKSFALNVRSGLVITTNMIADGQVGAPYSQGFAARYGTEPYNWAFDSGSIPPGLTFTSEGTLTGTPTVAGGYTFSLHLTDSTLPPLTAAQTYSLTIQAGLSITTTSLPAGAPETAYSATLQATGGTSPYTWSVVSGLLPPGLILAADGALAGKPTTAGAYSFTVQVADNNAPRLKATRLFSVAIGASLTINTDTLADARLGVSYRQTLTALNGAPPYYWTLEGGALPPGLLLLASGDIVGQPTAVGFYTFTVTVQDSVQPPTTAGQTFTINVIPGFAITTRLLPNGSPETPYQTTLAAQDGVTPYTWSIALGDLPLGLRLDPKAGAISGTPTKPGAYPLLIQATDSSSPVQTTTAQFTLAIDSTLQITTAILPDADTGTPYYQALAATNGVVPLTWSLGSALPPGLSLLPTGELYGVPTTTGKYRITVAMADSSQPPAHASRDLTILVSQSLTLLTDTVPAGTIMKPYAAAISAAGGTPPYRFSSTGSLPTGLSLSAIGAVTGTPTIPGIYSVTIQVTDAASKTQSCQFIFVIGAALTITTTSLPASSTNVPYFAAVKATGGAGPYVWTAVANPLPPGVTFLPSIAAFVGTPAKSGQYTIQILVTDGQHTASTTLTITITDPLTIPPAQLPAAQQGVPYSTTLVPAGGLPPYSWALGTGITLPAGLTLSSRGVLAGQPTGTLGVFPLSLCVTDSVRPQSSRYCTTRTLVVGPAFHIDVALLDPTLPGQRVSHQFTSSGGQGSITWTAAFALPSGLSLSPDGLLSGTPVTAGKYTLTIIASDTARQFAVADFEFLVSPPLTIATTVLPPATLGLPYAAGVLATHGTPPYHWTAPPNTLPPGFVLDASGILYGAPASARTDNITMTVADSATPSHTATATIILTTDAPMSITGGALPNATAGSSYATTLSATGVAPLQWAIASGQLPSGLSLTPDGAITGLPLAAGSSTFVASVLDDHGQTAAAPFTLLVTPSLTLGSNTELPPGTVGESYSHQFNTAFRGDVKWTLLLGLLPPGLRLGAEGTLTGTPTTIGTTSFMIQAAGADQSARKVYTLTVDPPDRPITPPPTIPATGAKLAPADLGQPYAASLTAASGTQPYAWALAQGLLPAGLTLSPEGAIAGTPTEAGSFAFALTITDATNQSASALFTLVVRGPLTILTQGPITAHFNSPLTAQLVASGGTPPYTWSTVAALPAGLTLSPNGLLSGQPTAPGSSTVTISVHDASSTTQPATATLQLQIDVIAGLGITTTSLPAAKRGEPYSMTLAAAGGSAPYTWTLWDGTLAPGLRLTTDGVVGGTPTSIGSYVFAVIVADTTAHTTNATFTLTVAEPLLITSSSTLEITVGKPVNFALGSTGGTQPYSWSVTAGALPPGLTLAKNGIIFGTLATAVTTTITVAVRDAGAPPATASQQLVITATGQLAIATTTLPAAALGAPFSTMLQASGGSAPYSWSAGAGTLPPGLHLSADGLLAGAPTSAGTHRFTVTVTDNAGQQATTTFVCTVASLAVTTTSLPPGFAGTPYTALLEARGGLPPYAWSAAGLMPKGLVFTPDGVLTGSPTVSFTGSLIFTVTDQANSKAATTISLLISAPAAPPLRLATLPAEIAPTTQRTLALSLSQPAPTDLSGQLTVTFTPDVSGRDDSSVTLVPANTRVMSFTIVKGSTAPRFETQPLLQAGTSAGVITVTATLFDSPAATATVTTRIAPAAPVITDAQIITRDTYSVTVELRGYSTTAEVATARFAFDGLPAVASQYTLEVKALFAAWYVSPAAANQGGLFEYKQSFNFSGETSKLASVTVVLTNSVGISVPYTMAARSF